MDSNRRSPISRFLILGAVLLTCLWSLSILKPHYSGGPALDIWMLNIGQGESVLVREPTGKKLLFDGGPSDAVLSELGSILPIWDRTIDLVILSHNHSDHVRGLIPVVERYSVKEVWISGALHTSGDYLEFLRTLKEKGLTPRITFFQPELCSVSSCPVVHPFGAGSLQVYHPLTSALGTRPTDQHDATVVVKASYLGQSILLTGDLNEEHEERMVHACHDPCSLRATILQEPHHGSSTGLSPGFLKAVSPQVSLIPVGTGNSYGHPGSVILDRLAAAKILVYRTDTQGRIHIVLSADRYTIQTGR